MGWSLKRWVLVQCLDTTLYKVIIPELKQSGECYIVGQVSKLNAYLPNIQLIRTN